jgi:hypothetical protein
LARQTGAAFTVEVGLESAGARRNPNEHLAGGAGGEGAADNNGARVLNCIPSNGILITMTTGQVRKLIDPTLPMHRLRYLMNTGKIILEKDALGNFVWHPKDVSKAMKLLGYGSEDHPPTTRHPA